MICSERPEPRKAANESHGRKNLELGEATLNALYEQDCQASNGHRISLGLGEVQLFVLVLTGGLLPQKF